MDARRAAQPDCPTVRYMIAGIQYAGRITDDFDRLLMVRGGPVGAVKAWQQTAGQGTEAVLGSGCHAAPLSLSLCRIMPAERQAADAHNHAHLALPPLFRPQDTYAEQYYQPEVLHKGAQLFRDERTGTGERRWGGVEQSPAGQHLAALASNAPGPSPAMFLHPVHAHSARPAAYEVPEGNEVEVFRNAIEALPDQDNPELFGLHSNADLTFRRLQVGRWLAARCGRQAWARSGSRGPACPPLWSRVHGPSTERPTPP